MSAIGRGLQRFLQKYIQFHSCYKPESHGFVFQEKLVVYEDSLDYSNLTDGSKHLLHSEFVRYFVASVGIMEYLGGNKTLTIEGVSPKFLPTMEGEMWRPWHHIYSLTKAGKGQKHKPQANQLGGMHQIIESLELKLHFR